MGHLKSLLNLSMVVKKMPLLQQVRVKFRIGKWYYCKTKVFKNHINIM